MTKQADLCGQDCAAVATARPEAGAAGFRSGQMIRRAFGAGAMRGLALLASFGMSVLLARKFGAAGVGEYYSIMGAAAIAAAVLMRGADLLLAREVGHWVINPERSMPLRKLTDQVIQSMLAHIRRPIVAGLSLIALGLYCVTDSPQHCAALLAGSLVLLVTQMACSLAQGLGRPAPALLLQTAALPAVTIPLIFMLQTATASAVVISSALLTICIAVAYVYRMIGQEDAKHERAGIGTQGPSAQTPAAAYASLNPFFWMTLGNQVIAWSPVLVLYFLRDPSSAGLFSAAAKLSSTLTLGVMVSNAVITRPLAASIARSDVTAIKQIVLEATLISAAIGVVPFAALLLFSDRIAALFGPAFASAASITKILLLGQAVFCGVGPSNFVLIMCRKENWIAVTSLIVAASLMILLPAAAMMGGEQALAWVYSAVVALNGLSLFHLCRVILGSMKAGGQGLVA